MTRREIAFFSIVLVSIGAGWGITIPLTKIAVSTGLGHFGLIFWQLVIGSVLMAALTLARGKRPMVSGPALRICAIVSLIGTLLPNSASYQAAVYLPAGVLALLLSMIPMFGYPVALAMGLDHFSPRRLAGLGVGLAGVLVLVMPGVSGSLDAPVFWMLVALIAGLCYALEGNVVAKWGTAGLDPIEVLFGASLIGALAILPVTLASGQFIAPRDLVSTPGAALLCSSVAHTIVYAGYVWLVVRAGPVFAIQVSYLVTGFGVLWARVILGEAYPPALWAALALMFAGMYLVQPRLKAELAVPGAIGETLRQSRQEQRPRS